MSMKNQISLKYSLFLKMYDMLLIYHELDKKALLFHNTPVVLGQYYYQTQHS